MSCHLIIFPLHTPVDVSFRTRTLGELYERDGHTYVRLTKLEIEPKVGDMRIYANGLVPDPALSEYTHRLLFTIYIPKTVLSAVCR